MFTILNNLESIRSGSVQRRAVLLKLTRTDGEVFAFTDHSSVITYDGVDYEPVGSFATSAEERQTGLRERTLETAGVITSDKITETDLLAGLFEDAMIERRVVDWQYPWAGVFSYQKWWIDETSFTSERWNATLSGWIGRLSKSAGDTVQRVCPHRLGDAKCQATPFTRTGMQPSAVTAGDRTSFFDSTLNADAEHLYRFGKITFTSGDNNGISVEVKDNVLDGGNMRIDLQLELPFDPALTDTYTIVQGCDGLASTCKDTFSNLDNFGGYPFVPGNDKMINPTR